MSMKLCTDKRCEARGQLQPSSNFRKNRAQCRKCENAAKRARKRAARPPLQVAYESRAEQEAKRALKSQHDALLEENEGLKERIFQMAKMYAPIQVINYKQPAWVRSDVVAFAIASDWHIEETVKAETVHGLNEYSVDIAGDRARRFFQNALRLTDIHARESKITTLNIDFLGDFFSGWIHDELKAATSMAPGKAAWCWAQMAISGIEYLLRESSYILEGDMIPGNHGRMTNQVYSSDPTGTSLETLAYHLVMAKFAGNPRVRFKVAEQAMIYRKVFEKFVIRKIHGYETKYQGGVGGLTIPLNKAIAQWDKAIRADLTELGHYHQYFPGGCFLANGSLIGYNLYAQTIKASYEPPTQAFHLIHARHGGEQILTAKIWVDEDKPQSELLNSTGS